MENLAELKSAIENKIPLVWNDPDPIKGNDYTIGWIEDLSLFEEDDMIDFVLVHYGRGSEAQVFLHEILIKK